MRPQSGQVLKRNVCVFLQHTTVRTGDAPGPAGPRRPGQGALVFTAARSLADPACRNAEPRKGPARFGEFCLHDTKPQMTLDSK